MTLARLPAYTADWARGNLRFEQSNISTYETYCAVRIDGKLIPIIESFFSGSDDAAPQRSVFRLLFQDGSARHRRISPN